MHEPRLFVGDPELKLVIPLAGGLTLADAYQVALAHAAADDLTVVDKPGEIVAGWVTEGTVHSPTKCVACSAGEHIQSATSGTEGAFLVALITCKVADPKPAEPSDGPGGGSGWRTVGFHPAAPGWRAVYVDPEATDGYHVAEVPGWLIQERQVVHADDGLEWAETHTRVVAARPRGVELVPADQCGFETWEVVPPSLGGALLDRAFARREVELAGRGGR